MTADISVLQVDPVTGQITLSVQAKKVSGIDKLVQVVVLTLLASPGSDLIDPAGGGGLPDLIGYSIDPNDLSELYSEISRRVSATQAEIIRNQIGSGESSEEKLRQIEIVSLSSANADEVGIRLRVENEVGRTRDIVI